MRQRWTPHSHILDPSPKDSRGAHLKSDMLCRVPREHGEVCFLRYKMLRDLCRRETSSFPIVAIQFDIDRLGSYSDLPEMSCQFPQTTKDPY